MKLIFKMLKLINSVYPSRTLEVDHDYIDTAKTGILGLVSGEISA